MALPPACLSGCTTSSPDEAPSALLVVIDTLRADRLAEDSGPAPRLRAWARQAAVFSNAEATAPFTMPSVATIMTGLYPDRTGVIAHVPGTALRTAPGATLAEAAAEAGMATGAVVSNPWLARATSGFSRGFGVFLSNRGDGGLPSRADARSVTDAAITLLRQWRGRRFFLWVHYFDPHMPYRPPAANAAAVGAPAEGSRVIADFERPDRDLTRLYAGKGYDERELEGTRRLYDGEVNYVDEQLSRLFAAAAETGGGRPAITAIVSDHGESLGEHGLFFAHDFTVYEELTHAVLMLRGPSIRPGERTGPVSLADLAPTLCRLLALRCPSEVDGTDLLEHSAGRASRGLFAAATPLRDRGARFAGLQVPGPDGRWSMVRQGDLKLVKIPTPGGARFELYDLRADARELHDLSGDESRAQSAAQLRALLEDWQQAMSRARPREQPPAAGDAARDERTLRSLGYLQ